MRLQSKLNAGKYANMDKFAADMRLIWSNAQLYNVPNSEIYNLATHMSDLFEKKFLKIKKTPAKSRYVLLGCVRGRMSDE